MDKAECIHVKNKRCCHKAVKKNFIGIKAKCLYETHPHGICTLKESLFDALKTIIDVDDRPKGCKDCAASLFSKFCEDCTVRTWPNVPKPQVAKIRSLSHYE